MIEATVRPSPESIAIIGIGCHLPGGVTDPESFWTLLCGGVDAISEVPADRWNIASFYHPSPAKPGTATTRWGGFLQQRIDEFDAHFFGISPREAAHLDPQQRWLLEVAWEALEDSGQAPERLAGTNTGVFVGAFLEDVKIFRMNGKNLDLIDAHTGTGAAMTMVSNRLSYVFDLHGPSMALDTACSSSLVAVHLACQSMWNGESTLAIAGGVNAMFQPEPTVTESKAGMLSPDGRCKTWDAGANGYVRGEGAAVVVLKPLSRALADGDPIHALIRGTAVNQDGRTNGITVPSHTAQKALMEEACRQAGVSPGRIRYVEAHGTGTPVGDPIEANALAAALSTDRPDGDKCIVGSVKTNIGHLEAAAGVAGLIKATLCLEHRQIPPNLHFHEPNPQIHLEELCVRVPQTVEPWPDEPGPALAAVNSFGFGGANAHAILEEAPAVRVSAAAAGRSTGRSELIPLSARSPAALQAFASRYSDFAGRDGGNGDARSGEGDGMPSVGDIAYSAALRRGHHDHRLAVVAHSPQELAEHLGASLVGETRPGLSSGRKIPGRYPKLVFVCSGMGPQWWAMGRELLEQEPVFRAAVERCDELLRQYADWSLLEELAADEAQSRMAETRIAQPANFALQVALADLWRSWGIEPDAIVGHSAGEIAAAHIAGTMSLEDAVRVIFHRSRLQHLTTGQGKLVAVGLPLDEARSALVGYEDRVSIAAVNSPSTVTLVGDPDALEAIVQPLQEREVFCRYLAVEVPYHSHYMDPLHDELLEALHGIDLSPAMLPLFSTVTGAASDGRELDAAYWWRNVREPVLFADAVTGLIDDGYEVFVELSPHPVLSNAIQECLALRARTGTVLPSLRRKTEERASMLGSLGALYTLGYPVNFGELHKDGGRFVRLPSYPWQRERHWDESPESAQYRIGRPVHPLLGRRLVSADPAWEITLDTWSIPFLEDHKIQGTMVYPGAAYVEMCLAAARQVIGDAAAIELGDIEFRKALFLPEGADPTVQVIFHPQESSFDIHSRPQGSQQPWAHHARGTVRQTPRRGSPTVGLDEVRRRCAREIGAADCYNLFSAMGLQYGPSFQGIERLWKGAGEALARIEMPESVDAAIEAYHLHPAILDACFQALIATAPDGDGGTAPGAYMPVGIDRICLRGRPSKGMWVHTRLTDQSADLVTGDFDLCDDDGAVVVEVRGVRAVALDQRTRGTAERVGDLFYDVQWQPQEHPRQEGDVELQDARTPGNWLIFADGKGVGRSLAALLEEGGDSVITVFPGESYRASDQGRHYWIDPGRPADIQQLFKDVCADSRPPCRGVVHLWGLDARPLAESDVDSLQEDQVLGCIAVMHTVQALTQAEWRTPPRLWVVTRGAQAVGDETSAVAAGQAPLWGLARTIGHQEHGELWGGIVDLDPGVPAGEAMMMFGELWDGRAADQVAFRGGRRYVPQLGRRADLAAPSVAPTFRPDGSYLITGGLGGLGLEFARWMIERGARRLILMGRSPVPPRSDWHEIGEGTPLAARIAAIRTIEAMGASIHMAAVDVTDERELGAYLKQYHREGWPPIRGVVHAAGVTHSQLLLHMDRATFEAVQRPKIRGAWLLHHLLQGEPLDFFVLFSSIASLGFSMGLSAYASGNAFLDALAHHRRAQGLPALSVNWGPWAEVGMASQADLVEYFTRRGLTPLLPEQGIEGFGRLFGSDAAQVAIASADWAVVAQNGYPAGAAPHMLAALLSAGETTDTLADSVPEKGRIKHELAQLIDPAERQQLVESYLVTQMARVLRLPVDAPALDAREPLNALGIDSLIAVELKNMIESDLGASVSVVGFLEGASIASMAAQVLDNLSMIDGSAGEQTNVEQLVAQVDELSDEEVDALLNQMLADGMVANG